MGATLAGVVAVRNHYSFDPRTRDGCDLGVVVCACQHKGFDPRTRDGCDNVLAYLAG